MVRILLYAMVGLLKYGMRCSVTLEMCAKRRQNRADMVGLPLVHRYVGVLLVEGAAFVVEVTEGVALGHDYTAVGEVAQPLLYRFKGQTEVDHRADLLEMRHGGFAVHRAPSRGDHRRDSIVAQGQVHGLLDSEKARLPLLPDDAVEAAAVPLLDDQVGVDEAVSQRLGGQYPHGAFPAGGHTDEDDVAAGVGVVHGGLRGGCLSALYYFLPSLSRKR